MQRDPDARLHVSNRTITRELAPHYAPIFTQIASSGLTDILQENGMLHPFQIEGATLHSDTLPFIAYPYEWCFSQYKAAALLTLDIQEISLQHGATLKDAKADNVQWRGTTPTFIDHSSFAPLDPSQPWRAYRQFCQHFLVPLFLMSRQHPEAHIAMRGQTDGMPIAQARAAMGMRDIASFGRLVHLYVHGGASAAKSHATGNFSLHKHRALVDSLRSTIHGLPAPSPRSSWANYANAMPYSEAAKQSKQQQLQDWLNNIKPAMLWDIGAHHGDYAALNQHGYSVAMDADIAAVDACYNAHKNQNHLQPLWVDINNPTPASGFAHNEHQSLTKRGKANGVLMLAITHHLRATGVGFADMAAWLAGVCQHALVEYIPADDVQAAPLLAARHCPFDDYTEARFVDAFSNHFTIQAVHPIADSKRKLVSLACA